MVLMGLSQDGSPLQTPHSAQQSLPQALATRWLRTSRRNGSWPDSHSRIVDSAQFLPLIAYDISGVGCRVTDAAYGANH